MSKRPTLNPEIQPKAVDNQSRSPDKWLKSARVCLELEREILIPVRGWYAGLLIPSCKPLQARPYPFSGYLLLKLQPKKFLCYPSMMSIVSGCDIVTPLYSAAIIWVPYLSESINICIGLQKPLAACRCIISINPSLIGIWSNSLLIELHPMCL